MIRSKTPLVALALAAAALAAIWFGVLTPKRDEAAKLDRGIADKRAELAQASARAAEYERAKAHYAVNYARVTLLGKAVPADDDARSLIVQVDRAADAAGVELRKVDASQGTATSGNAAGSTTRTEPTGFVELPVTFAFNGGYFGLTDLLRRVERFVVVNNSRLDVTGRLLLLKGVTLQPLANDDGKPTSRMRAEITAASYTFTPAPPVAGAKPPAAGAAAPATGGGSATAQAAAVTPTPTPTPAAGAGASTTTASATGVAR